MKKTIFFGFLAALFLMLLAMPTNDENVCAANAQAEIVIMPKIINHKVSYDVLGLPTGVELSTIVKDIKISPSSRMPIFGGYVHFTSSGTYIGNDGDDKVSFGETTLFVPINIIAISLFVVTTAIFVAVIIVAIIVFNKRRKANLITKGNAKESTSYE